MVVDIARAVRVFEILDWDACFDRAAASGAGRMLGFGLHLAHVLLEVEFPPQWSLGWCATPSLRN